MKTIGRFFIASLLLCILEMGGEICNSAAASERLIFANLESLYNAHRFSELEDYALSLLENPETLYPDELIAVHSYLGFTYVILRREQEAKYHFVQWLMLEPKAYLDPVLIPPNIIRVFELAKDSLRNRQSVVQTNKQGYDRWPFMKSALWRSMVIPGWGHYHCGQKQKGIIFFTAELLLLGGFFISNDEYSRARDDYYNETNFNNMSRLYDEYNSWNRIRWSAAAAGLLLYIGVQYDIFQYKIHSPAEEASLIIKPSLMRNPSSRSENIPAITLLILK